MQDVWAELCPGEVGCARGELQSSTSGSETGAEVVAEELRPRQGGQQTSAYQVIPVQHFTTFCIKAIITIIYTFL